MKIALLQLYVKWEAQAENIEKAGAYIKRASREGADVAVLPEMAMTGFTMNPSPAIDGENPAAHPALAELAAGNNINIVAGYNVIPSEPGSMGRNLAAAYDRSGARIALYSKMHPFTFLDEHRHYEAGEGPVVFQLDGMGASAFICYDLRFPESIRPVAPDVSALFFLANWPASRAEHWMALLRARAIENQCYAVGVNRVGTDDNGLFYHGGSCVYGPSGELIVMGGKGEEIVYLEIYPEEVARVRAEFPFLEDMK